MQGSGMLTEEGNEHIGRIMVYSIYTAMSIILCFVISDIKIFDDDMLGNPDEPGAVLGKTKEGEENSDDGASEKSGSASRLSSIKRADSRGSRGSGKDSKLRSMDSGIKRDEVDEDESRTSSFLSRLFDPNVWRRSISLKVRSYIISATAYFCSQGRR